MIVARRVLSLFTVVAVAIGLAACSSSGGSSDQTSNPSPNPSTKASSAPIKVGAMCSCSGSVGATQSAILKVYKAWVKTVNASGGLNGHPIELITKDDKTDPGTSVTSAEQLISADVDAIVNMSVLSATWAEKVKSAGIPVVGVNSTDAPFEKYSNFYPEGQTGSSSAYALVATAKAAGASGLGVLYCAESPICQNLLPGIESAGEKLGVPIEFKASVSSSAPNYTAQCVAAQQARADALVILGFAQVIIKVGKDCSRQGYNPKYVTIGSGFSMKLANSSGVGKNLWTEYPVLPFWADTPSIKAMNAAVDKYYPDLRADEDVWFEGAAMAWPSGLLLQSAVEAAGLTADEEPTAAKIVAGLHALKDETLDGWSPPLTYEPGKAHQVNCWFTGVVKNGTPHLVDNGKVTCTKG